MFGYVVEESLKVFVGAYRKTDEHVCVNDDAHR